MRNHASMKRLALWCLLLLSAGVAPSGAEVIARCGEGYLETADGYRVLHVKGTPYQMGYQHGVLLKEQCRSILHFLFEVKAEEASIEILGKKLRPQDAILMIFQIQRQFIPPRFIEEMRGLANGSGVELDDVFVANMIPELFHCSGFALLEELTDTGTLLHGRVLDYGIDWKLQEHAVLIVAEPEGKIPFVNVTYSGFIGSVTGMNRQEISIGEMGGRGLGKWAGTPMSFLVRRVLEEANSLGEAVAIFEDGRRTCEYFYVIADAKIDDAVGLEGSFDRFEIIRPGEKNERLPTPVPHSVLLSANDRYDNLSRLVRQVYDSSQRFSIEKAIRLMDAPVAMRSNLHNVLMAPGLGKLWVANASPDQKPAWTQKYYELDFWKLLDQRPPSGGEIFPPP